MRIYLVVPVLSILLVSCTKASTDPNGAQVAAERATSAIAARVDNLETRLAEVEKEAAQLRTRNAELTENLRNVEENVSLLEVAKLGPRVVVEPPRSSPRPTSTASSYQAASAATSTFTAPRSTPTQEPTRTIDAPAPVRQACEAQWGTDYKMVAFCLKTQMEAKAKLDRGNTSGLSPLAFDDIRRGCESKWGTYDYKMRSFCEDQQAKAYKEIGQPKGW